jgi:hypothetical protein
MKSLNLTSFFEKQASINRKYVGTQGKFIKSTKNYCGKW